MTEPPIKSSAKQSIESPSALSSDKNPPVPPLALSGATGVVGLLRWVGVATAVCCGDGDEIRFFSIFMTPTPQGC